MGIYSMQLSANEELNKQTQEAIEFGNRVAERYYYFDEDLKEVTEEVLKDTDIKESKKKDIIATGRRFFVFKYPSDGFLVKGTISFVSNNSKKPLLLFLRGGNRFFALTHPASDFMCIKDYTIISTTYRGGVSEGVDEFGGQEVNDVHHLIRYVPALQEKIGISINANEIYLLGGSRGAMEMFLALSRSEELQRLAKKAVSLSGLLDIRACIRQRPDMLEMFQSDFGLENEEEWIPSRDPIEAVSNIRNDLPFLIVQGTEDIRTSLEEGYHMLQKLQEQGNPVTYLEVPGGDHCLANQPNRMDLITDWFESP